LCADRDGHGGELRLQLLNLGLSWSSSLGFLETDSFSNDEPLDGKVATLQGTL
jgi:hypothetical protein